MDAASEAAGAIVTVDSGTANGGKIFTTNFKSTDTLNTTAMNWYEEIDSGTTQTLTNKTMSTSSVWNGNTIGVGYGGTGVTTFGGTNRLLYTTATDTLSSIATANSSIFYTDGSGVPTLGTSLPSHSVSGNLTVNSGSLTVGSGTNFTILDGGDNGLFTFNGSTRIFTITNSGLTTTITLNGATGAITATSLAGTGASITSLDAGNISAGTLAVGRGGTGLTSYAVGDLIYASGGATLAKLADVATGNALISGGVTTAPLWGKIGLTTHISGTLAIGNGGTGATSLTTNGILYGGSTVSATASANNSILVTNGSGVPSLSTTIPAFTAGGDIAMGGNKITGAADPSSAQDYATKAYVDSVAIGIMDFKNSVRAATTANITLSGAQTIDGVSVIAGDRVLVKNQSTASANGIYVCAAGSWSRSSDADASSEVTGGMFVFVTEGSTQADTGWVLSTNDAITLGSTSLSFTQFRGAGGHRGGVARLERRRSLRPRGSAAGHHYRHSRQRLESQPDSGG
jgi:hypothetical protein